MRIARENCGRTLGAPTKHTWKAVGAVSHQSEVIRNGFRFNTKLPKNSFFVADLVCPAVQLHDTSSLNALAEVLIRCADDNLVYARILRRLRSGSRKSVVGLVICHRPNHNAHRTEGVFEDRELG